MRVREKTAVIILLLGLWAPGAPSADLYSILSSDSRFSGRTYSVKRVVTRTNVVERLVRKDSTPHPPKKKTVVDSKSISPAANSFATNAVERKVLVPVTNTVEKIVKVEKRVLVPVTNTVEKIVEKRIVVPVTNTVEKVVEVERRVHIPVTNTVRQLVVVERTNVVDRIVVDRTRENQLLAREQKLLDRQKELDRDLAQEREHRQRLERVIPEEKRRFTDNTLSITAPVAFYDRKEGYAALEGGVRVNDQQYHLFSNRAFVFMEPASNTIARVVALEDVAVTNGSQRAYGIKASYYRKTGMVILYGDEKTPAIVRDESRVDDQEVIGEKIKFWINSEQVEVLKAHIRAPVSGGSGLQKNLLSR